MEVFDKATAKRAKQMAEAVLDNPRKCVLCTIKWCVMSDLCEGKTHQVIQNQPTHKGHSKEKI